jgi:carboxyl-terminal processing protease
MTFTERDRQKLLGKIDRLIATKFYDPNFKGHDWRSIVENHRTKILSAEQRSEFEAAVNGMLRELGSSGLGLISAGTAIAPKNSISATFRAVETEYGNRWAFQDVHAGGPASAAGICSGDVLIRIGDREVAPPKAPLFSMGQTHEVVVEKVSGRTNLIILVPGAKHKENPCAVPDSVRAHMSDGVAVMKIPLFPGKLGIDFARDLSDAFERHVNGTDRLVLDLRGNPGGGVGCLRLMSFLTPGRKPVGFSLDRETALRGFDKSRFPRFGRIPRSKLEIPLLALRFARKKSVVLVTEGLSSRAFQGRIVVLVNEHTTCASEMVALFAREEAGATIIGSATPGRLVSHTGFKVGHGFTLALPVAAYVSWAGTRVDGKGINPDVVVDWSYSDARRGADNQLQSAVSVAKGLRSASGADNTRGPIFF